MSFSRAIKTDIHRQDAIVGLFVLAAVLLVFYLLFQQSYLTYRQDEWLKLHSQLKNSYGLAPGTLIELSGVTVGKVVTVTLREDANVDINLVIDNQYRNLVTEGSKLTIGGALGLDSMISGVSMKLIPGSGKRLFESGDAIIILEPKDFNKMLEKVDLEALSMQVQQIVANIESLTSAMEKSKGDIAETLANANGISTTINQRIPETLNHLDSALATINTSVMKLQQQTQTLITPTTNTIQRADQLMQQLEPSLQLLPNTLNSLDTTLNSIDRLSRKLSHHWLLGNGGKEHQTDTHWEPYLLPDNELYEVRQ